MASPTWISGRSRPNHCPQASLPGPRHKPHPADWESRERSLKSALDDAEPREIHGDASARSSAFREVERDTTTLLALPLSVLPEPHRTEFFALQLRSKSGLGRCDEVEPAIPLLERSAEIAYPRQFDPDSPPVPHTVAEVGVLQASLARERREIEKFNAGLADGSLLKSPEWNEVPQSERRKIAVEQIAQAEREIRGY